MASVTISFLPVLVSSNVFAARTSSPHSSEQRLAALTTSRGHAGWIFSARSISLMTCASMVSIFMESLFQAFVFKFQLFDTLFRFQAVPAFQCSCQLAESGSTAAAFTLIIMFNDEAVIVGIAPVLFNIRR